VVASLIANFDEQHVLVQTKGYFIDITERRELESQLRHAQKMGAVGRLAGGIAHDFNNLLTGIIGYAQMLLHEHDLSPQATASAHEIFNAGKLAAVLTRQLLTFSRRQIVEPRVLDLNASVAELKRMLQRLIGEDIELDLRLSDEPLHVRADPGQIEQIIMNLAINSRDAMTRGGRLTIATSEASADSLLPPELAAGPHVKLTVSDNGAGMTPAVRARLFEPFFTTKPVGQGTGLGLSTVLGIVRQNKGAIAVETAPDVGTTFEVWLPRVQAAVEPIGVPAGPTAGTGKFARVLVVEDNELVRETTAQILRREGYDVVEASSANDAMRLMSNANFLPDLVLTDVVMPDRNGRDLADDLARLRPHLRVVFMSGYTDDAMIRYGLETHRRFVEKPFTRESLLRKMREVLNE
jgi:two-component system, cell cycle sensor histidine kinase and response regulator CckA